MLDRLLIPFDFTVTTVQRSIKLLYIGRVGWSAFTVVDVNTDGAGVRRVVRVEASEEFFITRVWKEAGSSQRCGEIISEESIGAFRAIR